MDNYCANKINRYMYLLTSLKIKQVQISECYSPSHVDHLCSIVFTERLVPLNILTPFFDVSVTTKCLGQ